ncbi:glycosyltransferase family 1 protein [Pseudoneobacillus rhizosphaerae]|nr:glycosyltransferase family 1 protein [Pseudoneobacillus rhizosphaerae]
MEKKFKILQVIGSLHIGGAENIAMNFSRYIDRSRFQCDYLVFTEDIGEYEKEAISLGSKVIHLDPPNKGYVNYYKNLKKILIDGKYDVVHSHTLLNNGLTLKVAYDSNIKKRISHSHSTNIMGKKNFLYKVYAYLMKKLIVKYSTSLIACGTEAGSYLYGEKLFKEKGILVNNGINIKDYVFNKEKRKIMRQKIGIENALVVGHVGRLTAVKNHDFLLDVFFHIHKLNRESILLLVGDGELRATIENKSKELGLEENVIVTGMRTDVPDLLQALDIIVFPSHFEGLPVTLIEAQASGVHSLVSDRVTSKVKATNLITFLPLEEKAEVWAGKLFDCLNNERRDRSQEMIAKGFDVYSTIIQLENIYEE